MNHPPRPSRRRAAFATTLLLTAAAPAQDLLTKAAPQTAPILLHNGVLHTVSGGVVLGGSLWLEHGRIRAVLAAGEQPSPPLGDDTIVIDLQGKHVYPGLISAHTSLGLVEIGAVRQTVDTSELGELTPEAIAAVAINPDSAAIPVARANGVLVAATFPSGGLLPGRASVIQLDGWTNADMTVRSEAGPVVAWPQQRHGDGLRRGRRGPASGDDDAGDAVAKQRQRIDLAFTAARAWLDARTIDAAVPIDIRHAALMPALRGEVPVFVLADELEQIESAVAWAARRQLRAVIVGGRDAAACATLLREHDVPVIVDGVHELPRREDSAYDEPFTLPARLAGAGVRFCIATGQDFSFDRNLPYHAATAAAFGLDRERALAAITLDAARILGVGDRLGSLEVGKDATLLVTDGDPLELPTRVELAFVGGRQVTLRSKQSELAKKYRERYRQQRGR
ncbi:MAG: amidohydrolase family protein [Planctomycetes bacterium]|nr:amidohydrolase family protein [Planctomycetota bacterium]